MKIALIGVGGMGKVHFDVYKDMKDVELTVCDSRLDMLKEKIGELPVRYYSDMDELLEAEDPELVDICTPTYMHAEQAVKAMEHGADVLSEKPMGLNSDDCKAILDAIERTGRRYMTAQVVRFMNVYAYLRGIIESGKYGKPESITLHRFGQVPLWSWKNWFLDEEKSGHVIFDLMIHDIDFMQSVFGEPHDIVGVYHPMANSTANPAADPMVNPIVNPIVNTLSNYAFANYIYDGFTVSVETGWYNDQKMNFSAGYKAVFENGNLILKDGVLYECNKTVDFNDAEKVGETGINISDVDGYAGEIKYFIECVKSGKVCDMATPESTAATISLVERTYRSLTKV